MKKDIGPIFPAAVEKRIPWSHKASDSIVKFTNGSMMQVMELEGAPSMVASNRQINQAAFARQVAFEPVTKDGYELSHIMFRRKAEAYKSKDAPSTFARELARKWQGGLNRRGYYRNKHYLSVIRRPFENAVQKSINKASSKADPHAVDQALKKELTLNCVAVCQNLNEYRPRVLGLKQREDGVAIDEVTSFLYATVNAGTEIDVAASMAPLKQVTPSAWKFMGTDTIEICPPGGKRAKRFCQVLTATNFEGGTMANLMNSVSAIDGEVIVAQSARMLNRLPFLKSLNAELRRLRWVTDATDERREELKFVASGLDTNRIKVIDHSLRVVCLGETMDELDECVESAVRCLGNANITCEARRGRKAMHDYFAVFPGNHDLANHPTKGTTDNIRGLFSFPGELKHNPGTSGLTLFSMPHADGSEHHFRPWVNGVPHMFMLGPNGSGKTTMLGKILAAFTAHDARIFALDRDQGLRTLILALGGSYRAIKPGSPLPNPFGLPDSPESHDFLVGLFELMGTDNGKANPKESTAINDAVQMVYRKPVALRSLEDLVKALEAKPGAENVALHIRQYLAGGRYGWLFAETPADITFADIQGFDTTYLLDQPVVDKVGLKFLFYHLDLITDGRLLIVPIDEGWSALDNETIERKLKSIGATARKQEIVFIFMTQSPDHVRDSTARGSIVDNTFTKLYFPHREVSAAVLKEVFDVAPWVVNVIKTLPVASRAFVMSQDGHYSVHRVDLGAQPEDIAVMSTRKRYLPILEESLETCGPDPEVWVPHFQHEVALAA